MSGTTRWINTCCSSRSPYGPTHIHTHKLQKKGFTSGSCASSDAEPHAKVQKTAHKMNIRQHSHEVAFVDASSVNQPEWSEDDSFIQLFLRLILLPISVPAAQPACPSISSSERILKEVSGVEPGWVEIMPLKRVTVHVRT